MVTANELDDLMDSVAFASELPEVPTEETGETIVAKIDTVADVNLVSDAEKASVATIYQKAEYTAQRLGVIKDLSDSARYTAFGHAIQVSEDKIFYITRSGTDHLQGGDVRLIEYTISTDEKAAARVILSPNASRELRDATAGIIGNNIFVFYTERNPTTGLTTEIGYIKSTDLTGTSWSARVPFAAPSLDAAIHFGSFVQGENEGEYFMAWYESMIDNSAFKVHVRRTLDSGATWDTIQAYSGAGALRITESALVGIGEGKYILYCRINAGGYMYQMTSSDDCQTWTAPVITNIGSSTIESMADVIYEEGKVMIMVQDRRDGFVKFYIQDAGKAFTTPAGYPTPAYYYFNHNFGTYINKLGYPSILPIKKGVYFLSWAYEISSTLAKIEYCIDSIANIQARLIEAKGVLPLVAKGLNVAHTGTTSETEVFSVNIPSKAIPKGANIQVVIAFTCNSSAGVKTVRQKINGTNAASNTYTTVGNSLSAFSWKSSDTELIYQGANVPLAAMVISDSADIVFSTTLQLASAGDTITVKYIHVHIYK